MATKSWKSYLSQLEDKLDLYLGQKAPALPTNIKEVIVRFAPWITLVIVILAAPAILALFGLGTLLAPVSFLAGPTIGLSYMVTMVLAVVGLVLEIMAIPGLFRKEKRSWNLLYWSALIGAFSNIITFNIIGLLIGTLLALYILLQIKSYYK